MPGGVWGESNSRDFLAWAEQCQKNAMASRGLHLNTSINFSNISHPKSIEAKEKILDMIQRSRQVSVSQLYNAMPPDLCANPTTKTLIMQLYYENNLRIEGTSSSNGRESNFTLIFENRKRKEERVVETPKKTYTKQQSNIEDLIDQNWRASGRKLDFDKFDRPSDNLNTSLKKEKPKHIVPTNEKPVQDVRELFKSQSKVQGATSPAPPQKRTPVPPPPVATPIPSIPKIEINIPEVPLTPIVVPKIEPMKVETPKMHFDNDLEFAGLSCMDLYLLECFFAQAGAVDPEKQKRSYYKANSDLCKQKGDIKYMDEDPRKGSVKFILGVLCIFIIPIFILASYNKNKVRAEAKKLYKKVRKQPYEQVKNNFKNKYPKVVK
jgi:hypothetical protein